MVALSDPRWLQGVFSTRLGLFYRVVLSTNIVKTVGMVCRSCQVAVTHLEEAYERRMAGARLSYRERQGLIVQCSEWRDEMALGSLEVHLNMNHGKAAGEKWYWGTMTPGIEPQTYKMDFPTFGPPRNWPIEGCRGWSATRTAMQVQFIHRHVWDTMIILEEVNLPHPQWHWSDMLVPWRAVNGRNLTTAQCSKGEEIKRWRMTEEELRESADRSFQAYTRPLDTVTSFK